MRSALIRVLSLAILSSCFAVHAADRDHELMAEASPEPGKLWVGTIERDPETPTGSEFTIIRYRPLGPVRTWFELARVNRRTVQMVHRGGELAVLLDGGDWMFVWGDGQSTGPRLPAKGRIVAMTGDFEPSGGGTIWALGAIHGGAAAVVAQPATTQFTSTTKPATTQASNFDQEPERVLLFSLDRSSWVQQLELPKDFGDPDLKYSMVAAGKKVAIATLSNEIIHVREWSRESGWTDLGEVKPDGHTTELKLLWGSDRPLVWAAQMTGAGALYRFENSWKAPVNLQVKDDLSKPTGRAVTVAADRLQFIYSKGDKLYRQIFRFTGESEDWSEITAPATSSNPPSYTQLLLMAALLFIILGTMRSRRTIDESVLEDEKLALAPMGSRLAAGVIDLLPVIITTFFIWVRIRNSDNPQDAVQDPICELISAIAIAIYVVHTLVTEVLTGRTLGKMLFGLKVVTIEGKPAGKGSLAVRNLLRIIDVALLFIPLFAVLFTPLRQRLGDVAGGTMVVARND